MPTSYRRRAYTPEELAVTTDKEWMPLAQLADLCALGADNLSTIICKAPQVRKQRVGNITYVSLKDFMAPRYAPTWVPTARYIKALSKADFHTIQQVRSWCEHLVEEQGDPRLLWCGFRIRLAIQLRAQAAVGLASLGFPVRLIGQVLGLNHSAVNNLLKRCDQLMEPDRETAVTQASYIQEHGALDLDRALAEAAKCWTGPERTAVLEYLHCRLGVAKHSARCRCVAGLSHVRSNRVRTHYAVEVLEHSGLPQYASLLLHDSARKSA